MVSFGCHCKERKKPVGERKWRIMTYKSRCSAFDGYRTLASDYSHVVCLTCGASGRTKAKFVNSLHMYDFGKSHADQTEGK